MASSKMKFNQTRERQNSLDIKTIKRGLLGGLANCLTALCVHPVDTTKIRLQMHGAMGFQSNVQYTNFFKSFYSIIKNESIGGLYKGIQASLIREGIYSSIRLGLYEHLRDYIISSTHLVIVENHQSPLWTKILAGSLSGLIGSIIACPLDVIKVRMQSCEMGDKSFRTHAFVVYRSFGSRGFYKGVEATVLRSIVLCACQLGAYDHIKHFLLLLNILEEGTKLHFLSSFLTGVISAFFTTPIDLVKTRLMNQPSDRLIYSGVIDCISKIYKNEGIRAFYKSFTAQWMRLGPGTIILFMTWEKLRKISGIDAI